MLDISRPETPGDGENVSFTLFDLVDLLLVETLDESSPRLTVPRVIVNRRRTDVTMMMIKLTSKHSV